MNEQILERGWFNLKLVDGSTTRIPYKVFKKCQSAYVGLENSNDERLKPIGSQLGQTQWSCEVIIYLIERHEERCKIGLSESSEIFCWLYFGNHKVASISQQEILSVAKRYYVE